MILLRTALLNAALLSTPFFTSSSSILLSVAVGHASLYNFRQVFVTAVLAFMGLWALLPYSFVSIYVLPFLSILGYFFTFVAFPPMQIAPPSGPYKVGVVDTFFEKTEAIKSKFSKQKHVKVRILYPAEEGTGTASSTPYQPLGTQICDEFMAFGAPGPLKKFGGLLHYWTLITLPFLRDAMPAKRLSSLPVVVYSHGLGGSASLYSFQAGELASRGYATILVEHSDGSAPLTEGRDGELIKHDITMYPLRETPEGAWDTPPYVKERRMQLEWRIHEVVEAAKIAVGRLSTSDPPELAGTNVSFKGKLDVEGGVHLVGHSFGGATILSAAAANPDIFKSVVAHDPAVDWMTDNSRYNLLKDSGHEGSGGYEKGLEEETGLDEVPTMMIYCEDWIKLKFGHSFVTIDNLNSGASGGKGSKGVVMQDMMHFEFSDNTLIQPVWLSRALNFCGTNPEKRAAEASMLTFEFLEQFR
mmetsp:Transcript_5945/g.12316  ORF Transcript_5945/g.12316 Transcript_5945/m.12316 type:complete len:472 (+) Transcript_5945:50-1465(+)|eukprot:CAMPEP_0197549318 /NCGR_PEP_ID=MMETSP1320-20131121/3237_1 /TAXON_ID=91990 /ORGANISM="Bolidomonas sp., Strain RCC2347" /LENGTH=471 /DNA_ID=CAMNT_0043109525 /DNA_START=227 /DNA_END=1642 /DNA_ORIENTATION=+